MKAPSVLAQVPTPGTGQLPPGLFSSGSNLIASWAMGIFGLLAFFALLFAAFTFLQVRNNHDSAEKLARLGWIAMACFLAFSAGAIISAVIALGGE